MKILIVSSVLPYPPVTGSKLRVASLVDWLLEEGHEVSFLLPLRNRCRFGEIRELKRRCENVFVIELLPFWAWVEHSMAFAARWLLSQFQWGRDYLRNRALRLMRQGTSGDDLKPVDSVWSDQSLKQSARFTRKMTEPPQVTLCIYITTSRILELPELRGSFKIIDTIDAMHQRLEMVRRGLGPGIACSAEEEARFLRRADAVLAIQKEEEEIFRRLVPDRKVILIGQPFEFEAEAPPWKNSSSTPSCLIVGSTSDANLEGLAWFQQFVWPLVLKEIPPAKLWVAGSMSIYALPEKSVHRLGVVDDLDKVYRQAGVVAVPILSGTGLKMKFVEAIAKGKAVVATSEGARGLPPSNAFLLADSPTLFAEHLAKLLKSGELRQHFEAQALSYAQEHFDREKVFAPLKALLEECQKKGRRIHSPAIDN